MDRPPLTRRDTEPASITKIQLNNPVLAMVPFDPAEFEQCVATSEEKRKHMQER